MIIQDLKAGAIFYMNFKHGIKLRCQVYKVTDKSVLYCINNTENLLNNRTKRLSNTKALRYISTSFITL